MTIYLKQSTASQEVPLGYFVDSTDGNTEEAGLTIANTDIKVWKSGATTLANKNSDGATHISNGIYYAVLDATDTDTLGPLVLFVHVAGALAVRLECLVMTAAAYDIMTGTTANVPANVTQISGDSTAADNLESAFDDTAGAVRWMGIIDQGTAQSATSTTLVLRSGASFANDEIVGATVVITGGSAGVGQSREITDYVSSTDTATVDTWTTTPSGTIEYKIYACPPASSVNVPNVNVVQISGDSTAADNLEAALDGTGGVTITAGLTGNVTGNLSGSVGSVTAAVTAGTISNNAITAAAINADAVTELQSGLATAAALATLDGKVDTVDTVVDAIKAKTDSLTFTVAGKVDSNITHVIGAAVQENGSTTTNWGGPP